jgi:hypothetical protein
MPSESDHFPEANTNKISPTYQINSATTGSNNPCGHEDLMYHSTGQM